jgi:hypothetical protein
LPDLVVELKEQFEFLSLRLGHGAGHVKSGLILQEIVDHRFKMAQALLG